jgi:hypothetical protein
LARVIELTMINDDNSGTTVWCTLVMLNDNYACGAAVVAHMLRASQTTFPIWCMVSPEVSPECVSWLATKFDHIVNVPLISHECVRLKSDKQNRIYGSWIAHSFTKWNILNPELFPVDKVIFIDADAMVWENIDAAVGAIREFAVTFSTPWAAPFTRPGIRNPYGRMRHGNTVSTTSIKSGFHNSIVGLATMVIVRPAADAFALMQEILSRRPLYGSSQCISGFDEQLLAEVLVELPVRRSSNMNSEPRATSIQYLHQKYNWYVGKHQWLRPGERAAVWQFYNTKPWQTPPADTVWDDERRWWEQAQIIMEADEDAKKWFYLSIGISHVAIPAGD